MCLLRSKDCDGMNSEFSALNKLQPLLYCGWCLQIIIAYKLSGILILPSDENSTFYNQLWAYTLHKHNN